MTGSLSPIRISNSSFSSLPTSTSLDDSYRLPSYNELLTSYMLSIPSKSNPLTRTGRFLLPLSTKALPLADTAIALIAPFCCILSISSRHSRMVAISFEDVIVICGELPTVRSTRVFCRLSISRPTNSCIETATAIPITINAVCAPPYFRNRTAIFNDIIVNSYESQ